MPILKWDLSEEDDKLVDQIVDRYAALCDKHSVDCDKGKLLMDITACHLNGCPLQLKEMLEGSELDFSHDVSGIKHHLNRRTGDLEDCFLPRFAAKE